MSKLATVLFVLLFILPIFGPMPSRAAENNVEKGDGEFAAEPVVAGEAIFAGGCFWCMEPPFEKLPGVLSVTSGYTGGEKAHPSYKEVSAGGTGHTEAVQILYDPAKITYQELLEVFWMNIDPTDAQGQFVDRGTQYRSGIFYLNDRQRELAEASRQKLQQSGRFKKPVVTEVVPASTFYPAEEYHQDYYKKNRVRYKFYRYNSGRDRFLDQHWGKERNGG